MASWRISISQRRSMYRPMPTTRLLQIDHSRYGKRAMLLAFRLARERRAVWHGTQSSMDSDLRVARKFNCHCPGIVSSASQSRRTTTRRTRRNPTRARIDDRRAWTTAQTAAARIISDGARRESGAACWRHAGTIRRAGPRNQSNFDCSLSRTADTCCAHFGQRNGHCSQRPGIDFQADRHQYI